MLGDILAQARRSSSDLQNWLRATDPDLMARVELGAAKEGQTPASYLRAAMADFERHATEEDWATLTSSLRRTDDPGRACVTVMAKWCLADASTSVERQGEDRK